MAVDLTSEKGVIQEHELLEEDVRAHLYKLCRQGEFVGNIRQLKHFLLRLAMVAKVMAPGHPINKICFNKACDLGLRSITKMK